MKFSALLALAPLVAAVSGSKQSNSSDAAFGVLSARSASPIHLLPLNAGGTYFWLGGNAHTYSPIPGIPDTNQTIITDGHFLNVEVPGGQAIYVDNKGALRFTSPHSAYEPAGSSNGPFEYTPGTSFGHWNFKGRGAHGFMACPTTNSTTSANSTTSYRRSRRGAATPRWQVFAALKNATVPSGKVQDCLGFDALAVPVDTTTAVAWEYI
ncbi:IgE binding protein, putative [Penicillium digitatum]|uniref:IgE binding protein, putative n=3 Tax=Penicillium digitatum TaxID=36651 RepID=K9GBY4_PEND2|nr:IgE binding protein, putative [Penicillium digitatum Pd1]EKV12358.1 IgE binding protein, putative [Penicillium digitatum PHI26]EKV20424.1 IgE binding protein, putative [Penicillium digitatum Pd1]QQK45275.1 IgE binding protein, putative [Penicillium digitatum]